MPFVARRPSARHLSVWLGLLLAQLSTAPSAAAAGRASNKANARKLATEGIGFYRDGDCPQAIDRLQRAERLYSAPVHLLYVARCQVQLGRLVEGAETYRAIVRTPVAAGAPKQFQAAVEDATTELETLVPEIPRLIVRVEPEPPDLRVTLNGEAVSTAVLGVERLTNPGLVTLTAEAPGFERSEETLQLKRSSIREVEIRLFAVPAGAQAVEGVPVSGEPEASDEAPSTKELESQTEEGGGGDIIWFASAGLQLFLPGGDIVGDASLTNQVGPGGGGTFRGGLTFLDYFTPFAYVSLFALAPMSDGRMADARNAGGVIYGAGMRFNTPRRQLGFFGEAAFARTSIGANGVNGCNVAFSGNDVQLGAGMDIPITRLFTLAPGFAFTFGKFNHVDVSCQETLKDVLIPDGSIQSSSQRGHFIFQVGVGGEFLFGG